MTQKQITLEVAAFLDSEPARSLTMVTRENQRVIVKAFLEVCYDGIGKKPQLLDGQDMHAALGHLLPEKFARKDPLADETPAVLEAFLDHLEQTTLVPAAYELRRSFSETIDEFQETVRTGQNTHHAHGREDTVVHRAPKLGRNDPCFCGSGKKFKKCHGKG